MVVIFAFAVGSLFRCWRPGRTRGAWLSLPLAAALATLSVGCGSDDEPRLASASAAARSWAAAVSAGDTRRACALMSQQGACDRTVSNLRRIGLRFRGPAESGSPLGPDEGYFAFSAGDGTVFATVSPSGQTFKVRIDVRVVG